jgi:two-component sensor histidine kinase
MRVLAIDDNPDDREIVRRELEALYPDVEVVELATRDDLLSALAGAPPDLVVTDLDLKWGSGREVFARTRELYPSCPVVMFTNSGDETTAVELMKAGLDDYVVKSARQLPRLRASLRLAVEGAHSRSALGKRERQLAAALERERVIVRELHHRVKNNLQTVTSLLLLRARDVGGEAAAHLEDLAGRMRALGTVQSRIYKTETLDEVDFRAVLADLAEGLAAVHGNGSVALTLALDGPLELDVARAMPLGLLCYELLLNAFKHAWPAGQQGRISVELRAKNLTQEVRIRDDGVGYVVGDVRRGLGTRLAHALAKEARVELEVSTYPGSGVAVTIQLAGKEGVHA